MDKVVNTIRAIIGLALLILVLIFCFQNMAAVDIRFLSFTAEGLPLFIALFGVLAFGGFIGFLFGLISGSKKRRVEEKEERQSSRKSKREKEEKEVIVRPEDADLDGTKSIL